MAGVGGAEGRYSGSSSVNPRRTASRSLTAHGPLNKALGRLEEFGLLTSHWEDGAAAEVGLVGGEHGRLR